MTNTYIKVAVTISLLIIKLSAASQTLPDNFKIGDYVEVFNNDSIKIYFNCGGTVVGKKCASYYRIGKMDSIIINITGSFTDYYTNGKVYLKANMLNNNLEGLSSYYYENGKLKEEGNYQSNVRQGKWTFYYPNGNVEKIYEYTDNEPLVLEAYKRDGKATVHDKNGNFETEFNIYKQCDEYKTSGQIKNGKKDGEWKFFASPNASLPISIETYDEGDFIKGGGNNEEYTDKPRIGLTAFYGNENLILLDNSVVCPGNAVSVWRYNNQNIHSSFYPQLQDELSKYDKPVQNQWLVVGIKVSKKNKIDEINIASSINDKNIENYIYNLLSKMTQWKTAVINSNKIESNIFFTILVDSNQIIIPVDYLFRNKEN
ncbi:hypothetical protein DC498_19335 [Terrimonas sp.]|uniref:toxin-antitoxin system YwqK family antitoxin n=1 Tax=Terrimonas sp. TaxID=1914338 RepID=UPI000D50A070|nr:hypothetical protein [Terrimonas sp.]PVD50581.1 hypothetical protein DC498_19335 [Terrimonas sp.]